MRLIKEITELANIMSKSLTIIYDKYKMSIYTTVTYNNPLVKAEGITLMSSSR